MRRRMRRKGSGRMMRWRKAKTCKGEVEEFRTKMRGARET